MRKQIPRFLLGSPKCWKTFQTSADCVVLPGFSTYDAAASHCQADSYCQANTAGVWELQSLECDRVRGRLEVACPQSLKLVAIDPAHAGELSLPAITMDTVCQALRSGAGMIDPDYRLMRDHPDSPWNHAKLAVAEPQAARSFSNKAQTWYVACVHPQNMKFAGGQPLWFWLDWFEGKHILTELQTERGGSMEREFFIFPSRIAAEGFYGATVARLLGCICHCQIEAPSGAEFEVTLWEKDREVCNRKAAAIGRADAAARVAG